MKDLLQCACEAARRAYAPYSQFRVGAALRAGGRIFTGCNVENASYGLTLCAERCALSAWIAAGGGREVGPVEAVALYCLDIRPDDCSHSEKPLRAAPCMPCGACRQWLVELAPGAVVVTNTGKHPMRVEELLPEAFGPPPGSGNTL